MDWQSACVGNDKLQKLNEFICYFVPEIVVLLFISE